MEIVIAVVQNNWSNSKFTSKDPQTYGLPWVNPVLYLILSYLETQMLGRCAHKKPKQTHTQQNPAISYESWETHTTNIIFLKNN